MSNCIDCVWAIQIDPMRQCRKACPEIKKCEGYVKAKRKIGGNKNVRGNVFKKRCK